MKAELRQTMVETLMEETEKGAEIVVLVSDSTSTSKISPFQEKFPRRLINVGIAEQNLVGAAAGMALGGMIPVTANAAPFLVSRSNEQVKADICYSKTNVKLIGLNPGFAYGSLGPTHHSIDDISVMRGFGSISLFAPQDPREVRNVFLHILGTDGPAYVRLDSLSCENLPGTEGVFTPGKISIHREGTGIALLCLGTAAHQGMAAAAILEEKGISATVAGISSIRPLDREALLSLLGRHDTVITVEEHSVHGGIGSLVAELAAEESLPIRLKRLGVPEGEFAPASPPEAIRALYRLDADGIASTAEDLVKSVTRRIS